MVTGAFLGGGGVMLLDPFSPQPPEDGCSLGSPGASASSSPLRSCSGTIGTLFAAGIVIDDQNVNAGAAMIAIAIGGLPRVTAQALASREVVTVALYRYAKGEPLPGEFDAAEFAQPFSRRGEQK